MSYVVLTGSIVGAAPPQGWVVADVQVRAERVEPFRARVRRRFELQTDDGRIVRVDSGGATLSSARSESRSGAWGELGATEVGALAERFGGGPSLPVRIEVSGVREGDRVYVEGEVLESVASPRAGYRDGTESGWPTSIRAERLGLEVAATRSIGARTLSGAAVAWCAACAALVLAAPAAGVLDGVLRGAWLGFGLVLACRVASAWRGHPHLSAIGISTHHLPAFVSVTFEEQVRTISGGLPAPPIAALAFVMAAPWGLRTLAPAALPAAMHGTGVGSTVFAVVASAGLTAYLLVDAYRRTREARRITRALLEALPRVDRASGWASLEGELVDGARLRHAIELQERASGTGRARSTTIRVTERSGGFERLAVRCGDAVVEIAAEHALWATTGWKDRRDAAARRLEVESTPGARVLFAGTFSKGSDELQAHGPESLLMFTAPAGANARRTLRRGLWLERAAFAGPVVSGLLVLARWLAG